MQNTIKKLLLLSLVLFQCFTTQSQTLVASYPFNGNANDAVGTNNGTVNGAILTSDRFDTPNSAYLFEGAENITTINVATTLTENWAIAFWIKPSSLSQAACIIANGDYDGLNQNGYALLMEDFDANSNQGNFLHTYFSNAQTLPASSSFSVPTGLELKNENKWYYIVMVRASGNITVYLNGIASTSVITAEPSMPSGNLTIGGASTLDNYFQGAIDDVEVFNGTFTAAEIFDKYLDVTYTENGPNYNPGSGYGQQLNRTGARATDPWINIGYGYDFENEPFTYETWVKRDDLHTTINDFGTALIVSENNNGWGIAFDNNNRLFFTKVGINGSFATGTIADTKWHHVAVVYTGSELKFYIDGLAAGTNVYTNTFDSGGNYTIGARRSLGNTNGDQTLNGMIDETRIWRNVALTETEIRDWMCKKLNSDHPQYQKLFGYFRFDDIPDDFYLNLGFGGNFPIITNPLLLQYSGAPIGQNSAHDYVNATKTVNLNYPNGETFTVTSSSGSPLGIQLYQVVGEPNAYTGIPVSLGDGETKYTGVFQIGGTNPIYTAVQNYTGNSFNPILENNFALMKRESNADLTWDIMPELPNITSNTFTITGQSTEYLMALKSETLPLNLISFSGKNTEYGNQLNWLTANEVALSHFEIEKSENAKIFIKIGELKANGGPSEKVEYSFIDSQITTLNSQLFYRLKMVDLDGKFKYSKIINIEYARFTPPLGAGGLIYPNPTSDYFSITNKEGLQSIEIVDLSGKILRKLSVSNSNKYQIDDLPKGTYLIKTIYYNSLNTSKIILK